MKHSITILLAALLCGAWAAIECRNANEVAQ